MSVREYRAPRSYRLGGYAISFEAAAPWAERLRGKKMDPYKYAPTIMMVIAAEMKKKHRILFRFVGENENLRFMFVTQGARFKGYRDMPPSEILQFTPCEQDKAVLKILEEEGITQYNSKRFSIEPPILSCH